MRARLLRALSIVLLSLSALSCGTSYTYLNSYSNQGYSLGDGRRISGKVFQTVTNYQAIVRVNTSSYDYLLVYIVKPYNSTGYFFDDMIINGNYIFIGTETYKTRNDMYKTVPVFVEEQSYVEGMVWNDVYERIDIRQSQ